MRIWGAHLTRAITACVIATVVLSQGISAPFVKDAEPQSAQWINGVVRGHWLLPNDYYGFVNRKPPLYYWLAAALTEATGGHLDEVRARAVALIAGVGLALLVLEWTARTIDAPTGWLAFFFLLGSYAFASRATVALTDMLLSLLLFATCAMIYPNLAPRLDSAPSRGRAIGAGVLLGLAILTKGPVAMILVALACAIDLLLAKRNPLRLMVWGWPWVMLLIALAIAAAWYIPAFAAGGRRGVAGVFLEENFGHFLPTGMGGTGEAARPVYYIVLRLLGGALPLTMLIPALSLTLVRAGFIEGARQPLRFQLAMVLAVVLFFSAASAKRDDYILPALAPLAILFAALFTASADRAGNALREVSATAIAASVLLGIVAMIVATNGGWIANLTTRMQSSDASYAAILLHGIASRRPPFMVFAAADSLGATLMLVGAFRRRPRLSGVGLAIVALAGSILWNGVLRPIEASMRSLATFAPEVCKQIGDAPVYVEHFDPEFSWYFGYGVPPLPRTIARDGAPSGPVYFVARPKELARLAPAVRAHLRLIAASGLTGAGGGPDLYHLPSARTLSDLNANHRGDK